MRFLIEQGRRPRIEIDCFDLGMTAKEWEELPAIEKIGCACKYGEELGDWDVTFKKTSPIRHAAIKKGGVVYVGHRHHDCIRVMADCGLPLPVGGVQGFVDSDGKFWTREQALMIAEQHSQIINKHSPFDQLLSEDMY